MYFWIDWAVNGLRFSCFFFHSFFRCIFWSVAGITHLSTLWLRSVGKLSRGAKSNRSAVFSFFIFVFLIIIASYLLTSFMGQFNCDLFQVHFLLKSKQSKISNCYLSKASRHWLSMWWCNWPNKLIKLYLCHKKVFWVLIRLCCFFLIRGQLGLIRELWL